MLQFCFWLKNLILSLFREPDVYFYPLRPEFVESTYLLYLATKSPFYQHVGLQIIDSFNLHTRVKCGFATVYNVMDKSLEDRMESFFLSETCKYLFLVCLFLFNLYYIIQYVILKYFIFLFYFCILFILFIFLFISLSF